MKKFNRSKRARILWFAGFVVLLYAYWWVMTNWVIRDFYDPQYVMKYERLRGIMKQYPEHPLWLVVGTSRAERGLRSSMYEDGLADKNAPVVFNFGMGGANLFREYIALRRIIEDGIKPQRVGIEIVGAIMSKEASIQADETLTRARARAEETGDFRDYSSNPSDFVKNWLWSRWNPNYEYGMRMPHQTLAWRLIPLPGMRHFESVPYDKWGWFATQPVTPESLYRENFKDIKKLYGNNFGDYKIQPKADHALHLILDMCKSAGIDVFLLRMPESSDFQAMYTPQANEVLGAYLAKIQSEYGIPMIDATSWVRNEGFEDGHHMNVTGATEFTRKFGEELSRLPAPRTSKP